MNILSISDSQNDSGASLYLDSEEKIVFSINEERINRKKMMYGFPNECIKLIQNKFPVNIDLIIVTGINTPPFPMRLFRNLQKKEYLIRNKDVKTKPSFTLDFFQNTLIWFHIKKENSILGRFSKIIAKACIKRDLPKNLKNKKIVFIEHHLSHTASAYYSSNFNSSLCISADGVGDGISISVSICKGNKIKRIYDSSYSDSLGHFYGLVTKYLGFTFHKEEGKVTGLAAYGNKDNVKFNFPFNVKDGILKSNIKIREMKKYLTKLNKNTKKDIAAWLQNGTEKCICDIIIYWIKQTNENNITLSGGLFANVKLNQIILDLNEVKQVYIFPHMSDGGLSYGSILAKLNKKIPLENIYLGDEFNNKEIKKVLQKYQKKISFKYYENIEVEIAKLLANSKIIARYKGRMEYGPRALGNRSILYTTTEKPVQKWLNKKLKRTDFMPFAPSTLEEFANNCYINYDKAKDTSRFMTTAFRCKNYMKQKSPAVVHIDETARPQIVLKKDNESYYKIIKEYYNLTKIPSILNTSFNIHGEPIVRTPEEAVKSFIKGKLDYLAIENYLIYINKGLGSN